MSGLKKELGLLQGMGLLATSLLGTGIFVVPATAATIAGQASLWNWLILIVLVLPIAFTFARLGRRYPHAGGAPHLIGLAFGAGAERFTAFLFLAVLPVGLPAALSMAAGFWHALLPLSGGGVWAVEVLTLLAIYLLGMRGPRSSGNLQLLIALAILALTLVVWFKGDLDWRQGLPAFPEAPSWPPMASALAVMFWCYVGLEAFAHMGEEFKHPERDYPIALLGGVLLAGVIYWANSVAVLTFGHYGSDADNNTAVPAMLADLFGEKARIVAALLGYLSCFASINIYLQGFARLIWSMARDGKLPARLGHLSRRGAPLNALGCVLGICLVSITLISWFELPLATLISYANGNFVIVYLLSMAAGWVLLPRIGKWLAGLSTLLCLAVLLALGSESGYALLLAVLYSIWSLLRRRSKARQSAALMQRSTD